MKTVPVGHIRKGKWWALVNSPKDLPVVFASRQDAIDNADNDEQLVQIEVRQVLPKQKAKKR